MPIPPIPASPSDKTTLESLPNELLNHIISLACDSQSIYRSFLLVCCRFHRIVKFERLPHIPVRLNTNTAQSFSEFIANDPQIAGCVRYLWLNGTSVVCMTIAEACTGLVCLACSKVILYSLCAAHKNLHTNLVELTLFDNEGCWTRTLWTHLNQLAQGQGIEICRQITHLRVHEQLSPDFRADLFPSLTHYSYSGNQITSTALIGQLAAIHELDKLDVIVITTFFWVDEPVDSRTKMLVSLDSRIRILYFGSREPGEFTLWCGRARNADCLWTRKTILKRLL